MKCPFCKNREHVEIDLHADGFSQDIRECGACGGMWTFSGTEMKIVKSKQHKAEKTLPGDLSASGLLTGIEQGQAEGQQQAACPKTQQGQDRRAFPKCRRREGHADSLTEHK